MTQILKTQIDPHPGVPVFRRLRLYCFDNLIFFNSQGVPATQTQEWLTQPVVGGDISFVDLDADARKRAKSGTSFETEGDSVIALNNVSRPSPNPSATPASKPVRSLASTPMHNSTMMPGAAALAAAAAAAAGEEGDEAMELDFSQIEAIEDDEVLSRTLEESLNMSKREEEEEERRLKMAIEASLKEVCVVGCVAKICVIVLV